MRLSIINIFVILCLSSCFQSTFGRGGDKRYRSRYRGRGGRQSLRGGWRGSSSNGGRRGPSSTGSQESQSSNGSLKDQSSISGGLDKQWSPLSSNEGSSYFLNTHSDSSNGKHSPSSSWYSPTNSRYPQSSNIHSPVLNNGVSSSPKGIYLPLSSNMPALPVRNRYPPPLNNRHTPLSSNKYLPPSISYSPATNSKYSPINNMRWNEPRSQNYKQISITNRYSPSGSLHSTKGEFYPPSSNKHLLSSKSSISQSPRGTDLRHSSSLPLSNKYSPHIRNNYSPTLNNRHLPLTSNGFSQLNTGNSPASSSWSPTSNVRLNKLNADFSPTSRYSQTRRRYSLSNNMHLPRSKSSDFTPPSKTIFRSSSSKYLLPNREHLTLNNVNSPPLLLQNLSPSSFVNKKTVAPTQITVFRKQPAYSQNYREENVIADFKQNNFPSKTLPSNPSAIYQPGQSDWQSDKSSTFYPRHLGVPKKKFLFTQHQSSVNQIQPWATRPAHPLQLE